MTKNSISLDGAKLQVNYHQNEQDVVGVPVMAIRDSISSAKEEVIQYSVGGFMFSGAFWLGFERVLTVGFKDAVFLSCIAFCICGACLTIFGFRQALRRVTRLERYVPDEG